MGADVDQPRLYDEFADWFHLLTSPGEYGEEAAYYSRLLEGTARVATILELGSGGGNNAFHLKRHFALTLVDASAAMLTVSRSLNPECEHVAGDMRTVRLGRHFDAVFIHDAISHMTSLEDLRATMRTAFVHLRDGGVALLCPDFVSETFMAGTSHGGYDDGARGLRYLEWTRDPDPDDSTYTTVFALLLRKGEEVRVEHDRHIFGLFPRDQWVQALRQTGFDCVELRPGPDRTEVFLAIKARRDRGR